MPKPNNPIPAELGHVLAAENPLAIPLALKLIQAGELVAFPTDTVYGVGGLVFSEAVILKIFNVKERERGKPIPVLVGEASDLSSLAADPGEKALKLARRFWPGALTLVVPRHPDVPASISPTPTIGVRMPDHPVALAILRQSGPLAVTSANLSGSDNPCTAQEVLAQLGGRIPLILDGGRTPGGTPSTVVDCTREKPVIIRQGPITLSEIIAALR